MNTPNNKRRRESRRKMEEVFVSLLQERELNRITVTDICKLAQVNRTTFYANYEDVYALAEAVKENLKHEVMELYEDEWKNRKSEHNFLKLLHHIKEHQALYRTYFKLSNGKQNVIGYDPMDAVKYHEGKHIDYHIAFFGNGFNAVVNMWLENDCRESPEEIYSIIQSEYHTLLRN